MARKSNDPAANGVEGIAVFSENTANVAQFWGAPNSLRIRPGPGGKADWLVSINGVCTDTPIRDRKLRRCRRFCAAIEHRFGTAFDPMPQSDWEAIVEAAIASEGGAP
jgi:hypothetical protein